MMNEGDSALFRQPDSDTHTDGRRKGFWEGSRSPKGSKKKKSEREKAEDAREARKKGKR